MSDRDDWEDDYTEECVECGGMYMPEGMLNEDLCLRCARELYDTDDPDAQNECRECGDMHSSEDMLNDELCLRCASDLYDEQEVVGEGDAGEWYTFNHR